MTAGPGLHASRLSIRDRDTPHVAIHDDARALSHGVGQERDERRLFGAGAAAVAAVTARIVLRATADVARQQAVVPLQPLESADQDTVASAGRGVVGVDAEDRKSVV